MHFYDLILKDALPPSFHALIEPSSILILLTWSPLLWLLLEWSKMPCFWKWSRHLGLNCRVTGKHRVRPPDGTHGQSNLHRRLLYNQYNFEPQSCSSTGARWEKMAQPNKNKIDWIISRESREFFDTLHFWHVLWWFKESPRCLNVFSTKHEWCNTAPSENSNDQPKRPSLWISTELVGPVLLAREFQSRS